MFSFVLCSVLLQFLSNYLASSQSLNCTSTCFNQSFYLFNVKISNYVSFSRILNVSKITDTSSNLISHIKNVEMSHFNIKCGSSYQRLSISMYIEMKIHTSHALYLSGTSVTYWCRSLKKKSKGTFVGEKKKNMTDVVSVI